MSHYAPKWGPQADIAEQGETGGLKLDDCGIFFLGWAIIFAEGQNLIIG